MSTKIDESFDGLSLQVTKACDLIDSLRAERAALKIEVQRLREALLGVLKYDYSNAYPDTSYDWEMAHAAVHVCETGDHDDCTPMIVVQPEETQQP